MTLTKKKFEVLYYDPADVESQIPPVPIEAISIGEAAIKAEEQAEMWIVIRVTAIAPFV